MLQDRKKRVKQAVQEGCLLEPYKSGQTPRLAKSSFGKSANDPTGGSSQPVLDTPMNTPNTPNTPNISTPGSRAGNSFWLLGHFTNAQRSTCVKVPISYCLPSQSTVTCCTCSISYTTRLRTACFTPRSTKLWPRHQQMCNFRRSSWTR